jgi:hypothetical protein
VKGKQKLLWLILPASFGVLYFPVIVGLDANWFSKEFLLMLPLQIAALGYVGYQYSRNRKSSRSD